MRSTVRIEEELDATACACGNFMQPHYQGAIADRLLGRSNLCDRYERMISCAIER
ncbi:hypothetical protein [Oscillatoria nigro-viridis]|uniref:hypothetical protein n=1 Tax=Phormidium nigroviride TaxID=482564 RepID=UPI000302BC1D|nr:hypothetical protein [Oscillatoria nigro-viridis]